MRLPNVRSVPNLPSQIPPVSYPPPLSWNWPGIFPTFPKLVPLLLSQPNRSSLLDPSLWLIQLLFFFSLSKYPVELNACCAQVSEFPNSNFLFFLNSVYTGLPNLPIFTRASETIARSLCACTTFFPSGGSPPQSSHSQRSGMSESFLPRLVQSRVLSAI